MALESHIAPKVGHSAKTPTSNRRRTYNDTRKEPTTVPNQNLRFFPGRVYTSGKYNFWHPHKRQFSSQNSHQHTAENAKPLAGQGGDRQSENFRDYNCNLERMSKGNNADYLTARIARDHPEILEGMKQGKYRSVRAAAIDAGIIDPNKTRRHQLPTDPTAAGQYLAKRVDAEWMATMLEAYQQDDRLLLIKITFCFIIDA